MKNIYLFLSAVLFLFLTANPLRAQWIQTQGPRYSIYGDDVYSLAISPAGGGTNIFAGTYGGGVFLSTNNGTSWTAVDSGLLDNMVVPALAVSDTNLFAGTWGGVFLSTNNGTSWVASGLTHTDVYAFAVSDTNLFAGTNGAGVFLSTDKGTRWTAVDSGLTQAYFRSLALSATTLFAGTYFGGGVFRSTNNGTSWTPVNAGLTDPHIWSLAISGTNVFAGTSGGVFRSTNHGTSWIAVNSGLTNMYVLSLAVSGTNLFAGTDGGGVFLSTDNGTSWTAVNSGLANLSIDAFAISGATLFAGTWGSGVWRRSLSEMITSVRLSPMELPTKFDLAQNYPNPFNPISTVQYQLPGNSKISLVVYNLLGQVVQVLKDGVVAAGFQSAEWNASAAASGVYFYRLEATRVSDPGKTFIRTRKMILSR